MENWDGNQYLYRIVCDTINTVFKILFKGKTIKNQNDFSVITLKFVLSIN